MLKADFTFLIPYGFAFKVSIKEFFHFTKKNYMIDPLILLFFNYARSVKEDRSSDRQPDLPICMLRKHPVQSHREKTIEVLIFTL